MSCWIVQVDLLRFADEKKRVNDHSLIANYGAGVMFSATEYCSSIFRRYMVDGNVLEMGPAEGIMTDLLYPSFPDYTIVDATDKFVEGIKKRHPGIKSYNSLFEKFEPDTLFDNIILGHVLEHVEDPVSTLKRCSTWLSNKGRIIAAVPNANSIHRQAGVLMGLLQTIYELNETDIKNGHRRVYDIDSLKNDFNMAGLEIRVCGGYWIKPMSNSQIDSSWDKEMIDSFLKLGEKYPDIAGEIYIIAIKVM